MKLILFISTISFFYLCNNQFPSKLQKKEIDFNTIQKEIEWFIDKVKPESYKQGIHNVYVVKFYVGHNEECCFTVGYIDNSLLYKFIKDFKCYLFIKNDLVVLDYSNGFFEKYSFKNAKNIKLLTDKQIITNKIDMKMEAIGIWSGYVCCFEKDSLRKVYYEDSDEIPDEKTIFKIQASGKVIEIDSSKLKQMLREMQESD